MKKLIVWRLRHWQKPNFELDLWLRRLSAMGCIVRDFISKYDVCAARRNILEHFVTQDIPAGAEYLMMIDEDVVPEKSTSNMLTADGDLIYCSALSPHEAGLGKKNHWGDGDFGLACCRISATVAKAIPIDRSFEFVWNETRTERVNCDCAYFRDLVQGLGFKTQMVGVVGQNVTAVLSPLEDGYKIRWPNTDIHADIP